jgi:hypothetical protein
MRILHGVAARLKFMKAAPVMSALGSEFDQTLAHIAEVVRSLKEELCTETPLRRAQLR